MNFFDRITTALGLAQALGIAAVAFYTTSSDDGTLNLKSPMFWVGMGIAVARAFSGYYTNKTPVPPVVT